ncbi:hypothetical protein [Hymenobacter mucosus]|uniref:Uncharacterized protein n=1 Tax=Hymenobacter mucosus TaxID=1411120 RepID=A0A239A8E0_9BACT|nr:hypothetical protein [Hymenobacter mucosus]SNR91840.1 hypothetical protein SAMN06269173_11156 [Hymenobacter mucosus]
MPLIDTDRLQLISTYARSYVKRSGAVGVGVGYIYQLIDAGKLEHITIDGVTFIVLPLPEKT